MMRDQIGLTIRIKLLEAVFGAEAMYSDNEKNDGKISKKTVEKWLAGKAEPNERTLQKLCNTVGITKSEFDAEYEELPGLLAQKGKHDLTEEQIKRELDYLRDKYLHGKTDEKGEGLMAVLSETMNSVSPNDLKRAFSMLKGYYYAYIKWFNWEKSENFLEPKVAIYKFLIKIDEINETLNVITAKLTTYNHLKDVRENTSEEKYGYHGVVIPVGKSLYFIFERSHEYSSHIGFVFIITRDRPLSHLLGMLTSEAGEPKKARFNLRRENIPASSRIVLMRIKEEEVALGEEELLRHVNFYEPDELKEITPELLDDLNRESTDGIFTAFI